MRNYLKSLSLAALALSAPLAASANTPSISGTTVPSATQLVDGQHNVWTLSGGQAYENGSPTPSSGVVLLLDDGSAVYQENIHHDWWVWGEGGWVASSDPRIVSPSGTTLPMATQIVDSGLNIWVVSNDQAYEKGQLTPSSGVVLLVFANDSVYQENIHHDWWRWVSGTWVTTSAPRYPSANGTTIPSAAQIIDEQSGVWTLSGEQAYRNGVLTPSSGVILLLYYGGSVYQENVHDDWWRWNGSAWVAVASDPRAGQPMAYVSNGNYTIAVVNTGTNQIVSTIPLAFLPEYLAVSPDAKHLYAAGNNGQNGNTDIAVIDTVHDTVTASLAVDGLPDGIAASPDGTKIYVVAHANATQNIVVYAVSTATEAVLATINTQTVDPGSPAIALSSDGKEAYVPSASSVSVIDTATNSVARAITLPGGGGEFYAAVISPDDTKLYTDVDGWNAVFNAATGGLTAKIPEVMTVGVFSPDSKHLYGVGLGGVAVIDTATNAATAAVANFALAGNVAITPDGLHLYITGTHSVSVADTSTYTISTVISGFNGPVAMAIASAAAK